MYRFICPDGRSYIGITPNVRVRPNIGVARRNIRLLAAYAIHPPETWTFEILERLPAGCPIRRAQLAEQRYIDKFRSQLPERGFNIQAARPSRW